MSVSVWLVRHGEAAASWGEHEDPGLSDLGWAQAEAAADALIGVVPSDVVLLSSPKQRAQDTAQPLARKLGCPVDIAPAYTEVTAPVPLPERQDWLRTFMGQTWLEQSEAVLAWRRDMLTHLMALETPTVIFSHFLAINALVAHVRQDAKTVQFWPDNASIHHFSVDPEGDLRLHALGREMETRIN